MFANHYGDPSEENRLLIESVEESEAESQEE